MSERNRPMSDANPTDEQIADRAMLNILAVTDKAYTTRAVAIEAARLAREHAAKVVDDHSRLWSDEDVLTDLQRIAAAIRAGGKP